MRCACSRDACIVAIVVMALWLFLVDRADVIAPPGGTCTCRHSQGVIDEYDA